MKKFFKGLLITLVVMIILPIALLFIFVFDTGKMAVTYDDNFTQETMTKKLVVDSLDHTVDEKQIKFSITEPALSEFCECRTVEDLVSFVENHMSRFDVR